MEILKNQSKDLTTQYSIPRTNYWKNSLRTTNKPLQNSETEDSKLFLSIQHNQGEQYWLHVAKNWNQINLTSKPSDSMYATSYQLCKGEYSSSSKKRDNHNSTSNATGTSKDKEYCHTTKKAKNRYRNEAGSNANSKTRLTNQSKKMNKLLTVNTFGDKGKADSKYWSKTNSLLLKVGASIPQK